MPKEKILRDATLCFLVKDAKVLLAVKTQKIGKGCWNGYGGGIGNGETPLQSALRELQEESGVKALQQDAKKVALIDFHNTTSDGVVFTCKVHVYLVQAFEGNPVSTKEMDNPTWFEKGSLPLEKMMLADQQWLPLVLAGKKLRAEFTYGPFQETLSKEVRIQVVDSFPNEQ